MYLYEPTPDEIEQATEQIRSTWSDKYTQLRQYRIFATEEEIEVHWPKVALTIPLIKLCHCDSRLANLI